MGPEISRRGDELNFPRFGRLGNDIPSTSNFVYRNPGPIYTPVMTRLHSLHLGQYLALRESHLQNRDLDQWDQESRTDRVVIREWSSGNRSANPTTTHTIFTHTLDNNRL